MMSDRCFGSGPGASSVLEPRIPGKQSIPCTGRSEVQPETCNIFLKNNLKNCQVLSWCVIMTHQSLTVYECGSWYVIPKHHKNPKPIRSKCIANCADKRQSPRMTDLHQASWKGLCLCSSSLVQVDPEYSDSECPARAKEDGRCTYCPWLPRSYQTGLLVILIKS